MCARCESALSRRFHKSAVAALLSAQSEDAAVSPRRVVGPDDRRAAIADFCGVGTQFGVGTKVGDVRVLDLRILALQVAANHDPPTAVLSAGIDAGLVHHDNSIAEHFDAAALGAGGGDAAVLVDIGILAGLEEDAATFIDHAAGIQSAAVPDDDAGDADASGLCRDAADIGGVALAAGDVHLDARRGAVDQADGLPGGQDCLALRRSDDAVIADVAADQINAAARRRGDAALVDDAHGVAVIDEQFAPGEEVLVADVERAGDEAGGIDPPAGADQDAGGIHQPDAAVGTERAVDRRRVVQYPVQHRTGSRRLGEARGLAGLDGELVPVDDGAIAVAHRQDVAGLVEGCGAVDHHGIDRVGQGRGGEEAGGDGGRAEALRRG